MTHDIIHTMPPTEMLTHGHFYTLPMELLNILGRSQKLKAFLNRSFAADRAIAEALQRFGSPICVFQSAVISFPFIKELPRPEIPESLLKEWGWSAEQWELNLNACLGQLEPVNRHCRAYMGWLLTNRDFLRERDLLLARWSAQIQEHGMPIPIANDHAEDMMKEPAFSACKSPATASKAEFGTDWCAFYKRWQLSGMVGPWLPIPILAHPVAFGHGLSINSYREMATPSSYPAIAPLPDAETLRKEIEAASGRRHGPPHLRRWMEVVENANRQRDPQITQFERLSRFAHLWRVLTSRYAIVIGCMEELRLNFADFLNVPEGTIQRDLRFIRNAERRS